LLFFMLSCWGHMYIYIYICIYRPQAAHGN
jgi:hypothetical protein